MCGWEGRGRKSETEKGNERERVLDGREWSLVETEMNPDQQRLTARGRGKKINDTGIEASKQTEQVQLFPKMHGHNCYSVSTYRSMYLSIHPSTYLPIYLPLSMLCNAKIEEKPKICSPLLEKV